jgi:hypothetical protein
VHQRQRVELWSESSAGDCDTWGLSPVLWSLNSVSLLFPTTCRVVCQSSIIKVKFNPQVHSLVVFQPCTTQSRTHILRLGIQQSLVTILVLYLIVSLVVIVMWLDFSIMSHDSFEIEYVEFIHNSRNLIVKTGYRALVSQTF